MLNRFDMFNARKIQEFVMFISRLVLRYPREAFCPLIYEYNISMVITHLLRATLWSHYISQFNVSFTTVVTFCFTTCRLYVHRCTRCTIICMNSVATRATFHTQVWPRQVGYITTHFISFYSIYFLNRQLLGNPNSS